MTHAAASSEAYLGQPFGVGRVTVDVLRGEPVLPLSDERFTVLEAKGRAIYPVLKQEPAKKIIRGLLGMDGPRKVTIYYLFREEAPFDLSTFTPHEQGVRVKPLSDAKQHRRLLQEWWKAYTGRYDSLLKDKSYQPVAENFLIASLSRRLGLTMPKPRSGFFFGKQRDYAFSYLLVDEAHLLRVDRAMMRQEPAEQLRPVPLPEPFLTAEPQLAEEPLAEVPLEPMASHVPAECFYVRFGSFSNYWWFRELNEKWFGDLGNMIRQRGIKRNASERVQQQLSLKENALAKIMGPQVIADAALIGLDHYVGQGAAIGILFQAKNNLLVATDMMNQRRRALTKYEDAQEETLKIDGHQVSWIYTPGGEVRSYYVQDDSFHLITTSRTLVERFLQAGKGNGSLASLASFRQARQKFPLERDDAMVAFVSEEYWKNLCRPAAFIENLRRLRSARESLLVELAGFAAQCEGKLGDQAQELVGADILPATFGHRIDGSELQAVEGQPLDSLRGKPGCFLPIADTQVGEVTAKEAATYKRFQEKLQSDVGLLPPIMIAVHRSASVENEPVTITVDVHAQGEMRKKLGWAATWLGQPATRKLQPVSDDVLAIEAVVDFQWQLRDGEATEHHLFAGLRDYLTPLVVKQGRLEPEQRSAEFVRGYLGAWPKPGLLAFLTGSQVATGPEPQAIDGEFWQAKQDEFLLLSFKPEVIQQVLPQLEIGAAERPAQLWVQLQDLTGTLLSKSVNALGYMRTRDTSTAGSRMMNSLANQLHVPRPLCREVAERLVDGQFVCPLGGEYQLYEPKRGLETWASSALSESNRFLLTEVPEDFSLPLLGWFRGLQGDLLLDDESLDAHLEIKLDQAALP